MPNVNFALSSQNKDQLRDLYNYLNQKVINRNQNVRALLHFRTPLLLLMIHHEKTRLKALP